MIRDFERLLKRIVEDPGAAITDLAILDAEDRQPLLADRRESAPPRSPELRASPNLSRTAELEPRTDVQRRLSRIFSSVLGAPRFSIQDDFFHIGGDSILSMRVVGLAVAEDLRIGVTDILEARTIEALAHRLEARFGVELERTLIRFRTSGKHAPLFLVHPAGGTAFGYRELADALGGEHPVYGLDAPDTYEGHSVSSMAASYVRAMRSVQPEGPYFLGGWSLGGLIAFEMARQLEESGQAVGLLALLDARPTSCEGQRIYIEHMRQDDAALLSLLARHLGALSAKKLSISYHELSQRCPLEREPWLYERLVALNIFTEDAVLRYVKRFVKNFRLVDVLIHGYVEALINADILLLRASAISEHYEGFPALEEAPLPGADESYGWRQLTRGTTSVRLVPGTHEDLIFSPNAASLAAILSAELRRAERALHPRKFLPIGAQGASINSH
jgi:thioesterase domain-containing protein